MKYLALLFALCNVQLLMAQSFSYKTLDQTSPLKAVINFSNNTEVDYEAKLQLIKAAPAPLIPGSLPAKKATLDAARQTYLALPTDKQTLQKATPPAPSIVKGFAAHFPNGTPNDNDIAVGNDGSIVSVINSNIALYNDTGRSIAIKSLSFFAQSLGTLNRTYDPRALYDPSTDRFIIVFLQGSTSADTRIITAFSKTNNPNGEWNFYVIPGNVFGDSSWSDYPIISISDNELFITINRLKDNTSWQEGFIESVIWQVNKKDGFAGDSLRQKGYYNIKHNNKSIWSICPVKGSNYTSGPNHYFLSVRPSDLSNDTVFLHEITNTLNANPELKTTILKTNIPYGLQPNAPQPSGQYMQTNDARVLSALKHDNTIHFVGNTINHPTFAPSVHYGRITLSAGTPTINSKIITYDSMDIGYPSIAYAGGGYKLDQTMFIAFSHVSKTKYPGNSAVFVDRNGELSAPIHIKIGEGSINVLGDTIERWGDYSGIQPKYNQLGECFLSSSYGIADGRHRTWIAHIKSNDPLLGLTNQPAQNNNALTVYPIPTSEYATTEFELKTSMLLTFTLIDVQGKKTEALLINKGKPGLNRFTFSTSQLASGTYILNISNQHETIFSKRIIVAH